MGLELFCFSMPETTPLALTLTEHAVKWAASYANKQGLPLFLAGDASGARMGFLVACRAGATVKISGVAAMEMDFDWPFPELSPLRQQHRLRVPFAAWGGTGAIQPFWDARNTLALDGEFFATGPSRDNSSLTVEQQIGRWILVTAHKLQIKPE
jgi:hypothetical protein